MNAICGICHVSPVPRTACWFMWCDPCLDELLDTGEDPGEFVVRKKGSAVR